ncbi:uroporphyrinogen decarboxylase [Paenibacillus sp. FSL H7-0942]|uniref:Uroporphyrinogen decarboxylase n=1 Tax=Paenibacillus amylolyticus TaxID=1451 RepID=A0ABD8AY82_PAEAM|nr:MULTISPECIES: uroporphyrinogen decarboxylase [Paenibacillus]APO45000.1 uroporphyrinogen decarboxylase [Paenibacillus xylanexedens]MBD8838241.1 uroporphyrinogen decarboxylase [Paenibacillus sp. CFBP 13594]MDQ0657362.1 uroporphyrinogen decarboxylase [Paenibacillus sp. W2I17]OMF09700.1 uroporphyrinogen decarboxylase [Paenibacillus amylolyticus]OMF48173.1 uroporphyrinogen decarboxylase [Paenibacillus amylolyticus]
MSYNDRLIRASFKQQVDRVPVWYMRQAGRYDPEYRKIKEKYSLLEICKQPELAAEVTLMPVRKLGVDAAILYSDIMNPVASLGIDFDIVKNIGPVIDNPIRSAADVDRLRPIDVEGDLSHILETIRILDKELDVPLITFAGAPFTIASYLIEGRPSKGYIRTKTMMYSEPEVWHKLMQKLGDMVITYVRAHIANGGKAFQLFDSWVGALSPKDFRTYVLPTITRIFTELSDLNVPKIYFPGVASGELLPALHNLQADVIGLDWRVSISEGRQRLGGKFAVQGNLDPYLLTAPMELIKEQAKVIIDEGIKEPGYIFNLGHGLFPEASLEKLRELTAYIHEYSAEAMKTGVTVTND